MRFKLPMHGRTHKHGGSDPIPGIEKFIRYDFSNVGDNLDIAVIATLIMRLSTAGVGQWSVLNSGDNPLFQINEAGNTFVNIPSGQSFLVNGNAGAVLTVDEGGALSIQLQATNKVTISNHLSASLFEVRENGTVHILTGGNIIADL